VLIANTAQLNVLQSDGHLTLSDEASTFVLEYRNVNGTYPSFETSLSKDWTGVLLGYFKSILKTNDIVLNDEEITDGSNYILEFTPGFSDPVFVRCYTNIKKAKQLSVDTKKRT